MHKSNIKAIVSSACLLLLGLGIYLSEINEVMRTNLLISLSIILSLITVQDYEYTQENKQDA